MTSLRSEPRPSLYGDLRAWALVQAESLAFMANLPDGCVDAIVTDPPYGIGFGGQAWDSGALEDGRGFQTFSKAWAEEAHRVLRPGGHLVAFGATRTFHRLVAGVEDAGMEVRDQLLWMFGNGVPKGLRIDGGRGTMLRPAYEPIVLARKPLVGATVANLERFGTGTLNIDETRIGGDRFWPTHVLLGHAPTCDEQRCNPDCPRVLVDRVTAHERGTTDRPLSRLFYAAKASRAEREAGCEVLPRQVRRIFPASGGRPRANTHPTVKPIALMRWLTRLVAPAGGLVLDPFTGSGSTGIGAVLEGRQFLGLEHEAEFVEIAQARLRHWTGTRE